MISFFKNKSGFTLLELSIAIAIFAIISSGVAVPLIGNYMSNLDDQRMVKASALLTDSWEAVRSIRNTLWSDLTLGRHGLSYDSGVWAFSGTSDTQGDFTREILVSAVQRDASGTLVDSGGTADPDSMKLTIRVSWQPPYSDERFISAAGLLTHYSSPGAWPIP